jgi:hypothetical protein
VTALVPLDPFTSGSGPLEVAPGTHGHLLDTVAGAEDPVPHELGSVVWSTPRQDPGDLGFLHPLALHRSAPNRSRLPRRILFLTYGSGEGCDVQAARLAEIYVDRFKAAIDAGGTFTPPVPSERRGGRSRS